MTIDKPATNEAKRKEWAMKEVVTTILTDASVRDATAIESTFMQQAVAAPWLDAA